MEQGIAVVTGASQGLGRGIARAFGSRGLKVYLTGRRAADLESAAEEVIRAGGSASAVVCDHAEDEQVAALFSRVHSEAGRLDILVNNAAAVHARDLSSSAPFFQKPLHLVDMLNVGLRSNYVAAYYAAPLMIETGGALMAHISFYGAVCAFHGPAYGAAKAGTDKMSFDMAQDLRPFDVASVSIWPGFILSDQLRSLPQEHLPPHLAESLPLWERPEFTGLVLERLWRDPERMQYSGETVIGAELGQRYGIRDVDGKAPQSFVEQMGSPRCRFRLSGFEETGLPGVTKPSGD